MKHHFAPLDRIRVSKKAQDQLLTLRRRTGLRQWNWLMPLGILPIHRRAFQAAHGPGAVG